MLHRTSQQQRIINGILQMAGMCDRDTGRAENLEWMSTMGIQQLAQQALPCNEITRIEM